MVEAQYVRTMASFHAGGPMLYGAMFDIRLGHGPVDPRRFAREPASRIPLHATTGHIAELIYNDKPGTPSRCVCGPPGATGSLRPLEGGPNIDTAVRTGGGKMKERTPRSVGVCSV